MNEPAWQYRGARWYLAWAREHGSERAVAEWSRRVRRLEAVLGGVVHG